MDKTQPGPTIRFVGAFDTVKALDDRNLHDTTFNLGIQHMRHAVALHENRRDMKPELEYAQPINEDERSFIQAWFVGAHMDLGGSKPHDGLSLYPLQWMLEESRLQGLVLGFDDIEGRKQIMDDPLGLVFPPDATSHTFETKNKIRIRMTDIRATHARREGLHERYKIKINNEKSRVWRREQRPIFMNDGGLSHYFNNGKRSHVSRAYSYADAKLTRAIWDNCPSFSVFPPLSPLSFAPRFGQTRECVAESSRGDRATHARKDQRYPGRLRLLEWS